MSWEAWGSDDPLTRWEETAQRQDFDALIDKWRAWLKTYGEDADHKMTMAVTDALDTFSQTMEGPL